MSSTLFLINNRKNDGEKNTLLFRTNVDCLECERWRERNKMFLHWFTYQKLKINKHCVFSRQLADKRHETFHSQRTFFFSLFACNRRNHIKKETMGYFWFFSIQKGKIVKNEKKRLLEGVLFFLLNAQKNLTRLT